MERAALSFRYLTGPRIDRPYSAAGPIRVGPGRGGGGQSARQAHFQRKSWRAQWNG